MDPWVLTPPAAVGLDLMHPFVPRSRSAYSLPFKKGGKLGCWGQDCPWFPLSPHLAPPTKQPQGRRSTGPPPPHLPVLCAAQAVCPELSSSEEDACVVSCNSDENCPQGTKCCPRSPCSRSCVVPLIGNTAAPTSQLRPVWGVGGANLL